MPTADLKGNYLGTSKEEWELALAIERARVNFCANCGSPHIRPFNGGRRWGYRLRLWRCQICRAKTRPIDDEDPITRMDAVYLLEDAPRLTGAARKNLNSWIASGDLQTVEVIKSATAKWVMVGRAAVMACAGSYNGPLPVHKQSYEWADEYGLTKVQFARKVSQFGVYPVYHKHVTLYSDWQLDGLPIAMSPRPRITPALKHLKEVEGGYVIDHVYDSKGKQKVYTSWQVARETARQVWVLREPEIPAGATVTVYGHRGKTTTPLLPRSEGAYVNVSGEEQFFTKDEIYE